jgi:hypothetical protein
MTEWQHFFEFFCRVSFDLDYRANVGLCDNLRRGSQSDYDHKNVPKILSISGERLFLEENSSEFLSPD